MASVTKMTRERGKERQVRSGEKPEVVFYQVRWKTPSRGTRKKNFTMKRDADAYAATVETAKSTDRYIDPSLGRIVLEAWWEQYDATVFRRATTVARDRTVMKTWWLPALGPRRLGSITPLDVQHVVNAMLAKQPKPLAPKTVRTNLGVFSGVMSRAVVAELISRSPGRGIEVPEVERRQPRFLTTEQLNELAGAVPVEYRPTIFLAGVLGLRWSEVAGLRVEAIDFLRRTINITKTVAEVEGVLIEDAPVKSKASQRSIGAPAAMIDMLAEHLRRASRSEPRDLIFQAPEGGPMRAANFRTRVWQPAVRDVGLDGFTFHSLRHSSVGFMVAAGAHPLVIQRRVGHASVSTTMDVYGQVLPEVDERVARDLGALFGQTVGSSDTGPENLGSVWGP
jgi:integrase